VCYGTTYFWKVAEVLTSHGRLKSRHPSASRRKTPCAGVAVLLSGGIDSSTCLAFYLAQGMSVQGIFVDYGQASAKRESRAAKVIAAHYGVPLIRLAWSGRTEKGGGLIRARNAFLVTGALMELPDQVSQLALGIHAGTPYVDCRPSFLSKIQAVVDQYELGSVRDLRGRKAKRNRIPACPHIWISSIRTSIHSFC
jgi:7-cyano-7-deazaguanine synthase in queuosine biosynthesis